MYWLNVSALCYRCATPAFQLAPRTDRCAHWGSRGIGGYPLTAGRAIVRRARLEQPLAPDGDGSSSRLRLLVMMPGVDQPDQAQQKQEHESAQISRHRRPRDM